MPEWPITERGRGNVGAENAVAAKGQANLLGNGPGKKEVPFVDGLKDSEMHEIPLEEINTSDTTFQYRLNSSIADLTVSLSQEGQKEPVDLVRSKAGPGNKPYRVIDGFRRVEALRNLGWATAKALVHRGISEEEAHKLAFIKNVVRKNLRPMDKANAIYLAKQRGRKVSELAKEFNLSEKQLKRYEALLAVPPDIQRLVDKGVVSMAHAKVLSDFSVSNLGEWVRKIGDNRVSVKQLRRDLGRAVGVKPIGRQKLYMKKEKNRIRMYPFTISRSDPREERRKVVGLLQDAIEVLKG
jgi:ParB family chromosome partitioning protein